MWSLSAQSGICFDAASYRISELFAAIMGLRLLDILLIERYLS